MEMRIRKRKLKRRSIPSENETPRKTPNILIANTSSHDEAAMTSVGIPASTP